MTILQLNSSLFSGAGESSRLADAFVARLAAAASASDVIVRDLARDPVPHLTAERFQAFNTAPDVRTVAQQAVVAEADTLVDELRRADTVVIGLPLYNFGVPSTLKAYFDHVARAGVTFRYTENGPVGLLTGKRAYVLATRGGRYAGTPSDTQTEYVRNFLAFLGIRDVEFVYAEGLALGPDAKSGALAQAARTIDALAVPEAVAA